MKNYPSWLPGVRTKSLLKRCLKCGLKVETSSSKCFKCGGDLVLLSPYDRGEKSNDGQR